MRVLKPSEIKKVREDLEMSQAQFAKAFHLSFRTVQQWEQGRNQAQRPNGGLAVAYWSNTPPDPEGTEGRLNRARRHQGVVVGMALHHVLLRPSSASQMAASFALHGDSRVTVSPHFRCKGTLVQRSGRWGKSSGEPRTADRGLERRLGLAAADRQFGVLGEGAIGRQFRCDSSNADDGKWFPHFSHEPGPIAGPE